MDRAPLLFGVIATLLTFGVEHILNRSVGTEPSDILLATNESYRNNVGATAIPGPLLPRTHYHRVVTGHGRYHYQRQPYRVGGVLVGLLMTLLCAALYNLARYCYSAWRMLRQKMQKAYDNNKRLSSRRHHPVVDISSPSADSDEKEDERDDKGNDESDISGPQTPVVPRRYKSRSTANKRNKSATSERSRSRKPAAASRKKSPAPRRQAAASPKRRASSRKRSKEVDEETKQPPRRSKRTTRRKN